MYRQAQLIHNTDYTNNRVTYLKKKNKKKKKKNKKKQKKNIKCE